MSRSRAWCFTLNNYTEEDELLVYNMATYCKYVVVGREVGDSGTPHYQGFIYFDNARTLCQVKSILERAHWEPMKGTPNQAADYCKKDGDFFEAGVCPFSQQEKGAAGTEALKERWALAKEGRFEELPPENLRIYEYIYRRNLEVKDRDTLDNLWIWGPSGCGKSSYVRHTHPVFYTKGMNKWWDGYNGEEVVLLDDFDPSHGKFLSYYLKIWSDHYAFNAEVKGGMLKVRPKVLIVTSQYPIEACFESKEEVEAISRRFQVNCMGPPPNVYAPLFNH